MPSLPRGGHLPGPTLSPFPGAGSDAGNGVVDAGRDVVDLLDAV
jgi:hypothetical protein